MWVSWITIVIIYYTQSINNTYTHIQIKNAKMLNLQVKTQYQVMLFDDVHMCSLSLSTSFQVTVPAAFSDGYSDCHQRPRKDSSSRGTINCCRTSIWHECVWHCCHALYAFLLSRCGVWLFSGAPLYTWHFDILTLWWQQCMLCLLEVPVALLKFTSRLVFSENSCLYCHCAP